MTTMTYFTHIVTDHVMTSEQSSEILAEIANRTAAGLTDGIIYRFVAPGDRTRYWVDQTAANNWQTWIVNYAAQQGFDFLLIEIGKLAE